jgi:hypothetical protein
MHTNKRYTVIYIRWLVFALLIVCLLSLPIVDALNNARLLSEPQRPVLLRLEIIHCANVVLLILLIVMDGISPDVSAWRASRRFGRRVLIIISYVIVGIMFAIYYFTPYPV